MTPTEKGMYCSNCKKEVIDFTYFSNYELAKRINQNGTVCGRFLPSQINTELKYSKTNSLQKVAISFGFSSLFLTSPAFSQTKKPNIEIVEKDSTEKIIEKYKDIEIHGTVVDEIGGLPGVNISQKNKKNYVQSDVNGNYTITIPYQDFEKKVFLNFSFLGMADIEKQIYKTQEKLNIKMGESTIWMGESVIVKKPNIFKRIRNLFR